MHGVASPVISAAELKLMLQENPRARLLDVRTPAEFDSVRIEGAYNVPLDSLGEHAREIRAIVEDPVILVCQSGVRARRAEVALREAGMPNLHVLDGGVNGWVSAGEVVLRGRERLSLERQVRVAAGALAFAGGLLALLVHPLFAAIPTFVGGGLVQAGLTDNCLMAMLLAKLPYNRPASCDVDAMVRALTAGTEPAPVTRATEVTTTRSCCAS